MHVKILTWNLNGVKAKFLNENIQKIFSTFDIVIINETHFGVRARCPDGFLLVGGSSKLNSKVHRGGVAIYKNLSCNFPLELVYDGLKDCVICGVPNSDFILAGIYIPPYNSIYFDDMYFTNLDIIYN